MPVTIQRERPNTADAIRLIDALEEELDALYPPESQHGYSVEKLIAQGVDFFTIWVDGDLAGCGGIQLFGTEYGELKRMYVRPEFRGLKLGHVLIDRLAEHARSRGVPLLRLETGVDSIAAIRLYESAGFTEIPAFTPYEPDPLCVFYERPV